LFDHNAIGHFDAVFLQPVPDLAPDLGGTVAALTLSMRRRRPAGME
jgi:hypothetical protein